MGRGHSGARHRGSLVTVELEPGRLVKMHREDAVAAGLLEGKKRRAAEDKMRRSEGDKSQTPSSKPLEMGQEGDAGREMEGIGDDLTEIPGVGPSLAAHLRDCGFETLELLRTANLDGVDARARYAIERWRDE